MKEEENIAKSKAIGDYLDYKFQVVAENKEIQHKNWKKRMTRMIENLNTKMECGSKNAIQKHHQLIKLREEKQARAFNSRLEREDRLEKLQYNQEMIAMNERLKDLCKRQTDINDTIDA